MLDKQLLESCKMLRAYFSGPEPWPREFAPIVPQLREFLAGVEDLGDRLGLVELALRTLHQEQEAVSPRRLTQEELARQYPFYETMRLRFVERDGRRIIQQYFMRPVIPLDRMPLEGYAACEWRDVPLLETV
jgi:hypothetical protein